MDWQEDLQSNLWIFPRGMKRDGGLGEQVSLAWTSKYGSVVASVYEGGTADGMNEKGLVANLLYLAESEYALPDDIPQVEKQYNVSTERNGRAMAGPSMGGAESMHTGLNHLETFAWLGSFSGAFNTWPLTRLLVAEVSQPATS
jgi:hypothetical protein